MLVLVGFMCFVSPLCFNYFGGKRKSRSDDRPIERISDIQFLSLVFLTDNQLTVLPGVLACRFPAFLAVRCGEANRQPALVDYVLHRTFREGMIQTGKLRETFGKRRKPFLQFRIEREDTGFTVSLVENDDRFPFFFCHSRKHHLLSWLTSGQKKKPMKVIR